MTTIPLLRKTTVADLVPAQQKQIVTISATATVPEALRILAEHNISAAPVKQGDEFLGFVDFVDVVTFVVDITGTAHDLKSLHGSSFMQVLNQERTFQQQHVGAIVDLSKRNPFWPIRKDMTLLAALQLFAKTGAHRLPVLDEHKHIAHIVSLSDVVAFLNAHIAELGPVAHKTVRELPSSSTEVISVHVNDSALDAFHKMSSHRVSGVAVLEGDGTILTNLSAKDIKIIMKGMMLPKLYEPARQFVAEVRQANLFSFAPSVTTHEADTLDSVIAKLASTRLHRVYVKQGDNERPSGVIALADVVKAVLAVDADPAGLA